DYAMQPWKTLAATTGVGVLSEGWNLAESPEPGVARVYTLEVPFAEPFFNPPVVQAGLTGFDMDHAFSGRLSLKVITITPSGFSVSISTWEDSKVYAVEFSWLAIGA
ncbi:MAG TPA: H-type lectin domain-containing protein, partial [Verrucomicrobium sp.]|nr:H-type lectin domain-containing protein [Verrucomicrobium sp.]